jgi:phage gp46-like protein
MAVLWDTVMVADSAGRIRGDWALSDPIVEPNNIGGFQSKDHLATAIILALYTNRKIPDYMVDLHEYTKLDSFEWHGNTYGIEPDEAPLGSLLHTLRRAPLNETTARKAEHFAAEALQVLVKHHWVSSFTIDCHVDKPNGKLTIHILAALPDQPPREFFADLWPLQ